MSDVTRTTEAAIAIAKDLSYIVCVPRPDELFIDIDSQEIPDVVEERLLELQKKIPPLYNSDQPLVIRRTRSPGGNWHIRVTMPFYMNEAERIAWQAVLGSDLLREYLSMFRVKTHDPTPTIFFEKPDWRDATR